MTSTRGISEPRSVDFLTPTLQTIPEAIGRNIVIARPRTRSRTMAVVKAQCGVQPDNRHIYGDIEEIAL